MWRQLPEIERPEIVALRIGLRSARANVVPMIVLWALADEFGLTLFLTAPADAAFFFWVGRDFSIARAWRERPQRFFFGLVLPNLISNWCVWIPVSLVIFAFPLPLQVQVSGFVAAFWTLMCLQIGLRTKYALVV